MSIVHNFADSLALSHAAEDLPLWDVVYHKAFPTMACMVNHRQDGYLTRRRSRRTRPAKLRTFSPIASEAKQ